MKRTILAVTAMVLVLLASQLAWCEEKSPKQVAQTAMELLQQGKSQKLKKLIFTEDADLIDNIGETVGNWQDILGRNFSKWEFGEEKIEESKATVEITLTKKGGGTVTKQMSLEKEEDAWKCRTYNIVDKVDNKEIPAFLFNYR